MIVGLLSVAWAGCLHQGNLVDGARVVSGRSVLSAPETLLLGGVSVSLPAGTSHTVGCADESFAPDGVISLGGIQVKGPLKTALNAEGQPRGEARIVSARLLEPLPLLDSTPVAGVVLFRCAEQCELVGGTVASEHVLETSDGERLVVPVGALAWTERAGEVTRSAWLGPVTGDLGHRPIQEALFRQQSPTHELIAACTSVGDVGVEGRADCQGTVLARRYDPDAVGVAQRRSLRGRLGLSVGWGPDRALASDPRIDLTLRDTQLGRSLQLTFRDEPVTTASFGHTLPFDLRIDIPGVPAGCSLDTVEMDLFPSTLPGFACWTGSGTERRRISLSD